MILPQIPTDNLYKFLFVSGIVLIIGSVLFYATKFMELREKSDLMDLTVANEKVKTKKYQLQFEMDSAQVTDIN